MRPWRRGPKAKHAGNGHAALPAVGQCAGKAWRSPPSTAYQNLEGLNFDPNITEIDMRSYGIRVTGWKVEVSGTQYRKGSMCLSIFW